MRFKIIRHTTYKIEAPLHVHMHWNNIWHLKSSYFIRAETISSKAAMEIRSFSFALAVVVLGVVVVPSSYAGELAINSACTTVKLEKVLLVLEENLGSKNIQESTCPWNVCGICLIEIRKNIFALCDSAIGGQVNVTDCYLSCKQYSF